jgi:hypothetical protein
MITMKMNDEITRQQQELASLIDRHTPSAGTHDTAISFLKLFRYDGESCVVYCRTRIEISDVRTRMLSL